MDFCFAPLSPILRLNAIEGGTTPAAFPFYRHRMSDLFRMNCVEKISKRKEKTMGQMDVESRRHLRRRRDLRGDVPGGMPRQATQPPMRSMEDFETPPPGYDLETRSFFDRIGDEVRSWFGDEEAERRRQYDEQMHHSYMETYRVGFASPGASGGPRGYGPMTYPQTGAISSRPPRPFIEHDREFDLEYQVWRERQMAAMDREYQEYRQERQQQFEESFNGWREKRSAQQACLDQVTEHMEVVGSDGAHVGTVDCLRGETVVLTRTDPGAGGVHHSIPSRWIERVEDKLILSIPGTQAQAEWRSEEG